MRPVTSPEAGPRLREAQGEKELSEEEGMVANRRQARFKTAIGLLLIPCFTAVAEGIPGAAATPSVVK